LESLKRRDHSEDLGVDETIILKWNFRKYDVNEWYVFIWVRTGIGGEL
jgi:hypothetical protein